MSKAFVDTTIIANLLLKPGAPQDEAKAALARYSETILPVFAIKEFRGGAFRYYIWAHNKLVEKGNIPDFIVAANAIWRQAYLNGNAPSNGRQAVGPLRPQDNRPLRPHSQRPREGGGGSYRGNHRGGYGGKERGGYSEF